ncbi:MAG TPA: hypothetical protein PKD99_02355 [Sphingopyxis sp.]|nr:hypothetical protein [Sphingopyxis sp.]HMP43919.1 hypothetical protein [Sphingopyxis sp.]HMQ18086.1 hypothetical protein [Sphingopyxis sp.]
MGIDLAALKREVDNGSGDCVVTRRWLRQVLNELREARAMAALLSKPPHTATLDYDRFAGERSSG